MTREFSIDEANVESHEFGFHNNKLALDPAWEKAHVARLESMIRRDRKLSAFLGIYSETV